MSCPGICCVFRKYFSVDSLTFNISDNSFAVRRFGIEFMAFLRNNCSPPKCRMFYRFFFLSSFIFALMIVYTSAKNRDSLALLHPAVSFSNLPKKARRSIFTSCFSDSRGTQTIICLYPAAYILARYAACFSLFDNGTFLSKINLSRLLVTVKKNLLNFKDFFGSVNEYQKKYKKNHFFSKFA